MDALGLEIHTRIGVVSRPLFLGLKILSHLLAQKLDAARTKAERRIDHPTFCMGVTLVLGIID